MKRNQLSVFSLILLIVLSSVVAFGQRREDRQAISAASSLYVVSAKAGGVNYVEGKVAVTRETGKSGLLLKGDELEVGDRIETGADGKAEILLTPGSFVRLAENSKFEFVTTSLDDLQLKINGGSAMFEVITDAEFGFSVKTPKAAFEIVKSGVYRVDVLNDGNGKIEVWKGRAFANNTEIKSGRQATVDGAQTIVAKFDRDEKDALELWSKTRAKELAKVNARLQNAAVRQSLVRSFYGSRWNLYNSYGLWMYDAAFGGYCFLPFGYGWNSPYGYYYRRDIWHYNLPPVIYTAPPNNNPTVTIIDLKPRGPIRNPRADSVAGDDVPVRVRPPYTRVQNDIGVGGGTVFSNDPFDGGRNDGGGRSNNGNSFPTIIQSAPVQQQQQPVISAPSGPRRNNN